jgi:hypothetical protein
MAHAKEANAFQKWAQLVAGEAETRRLLARRAAKRERAAKLRSLAALQSLARRKQGARARGVRAQSWCERRRARCVALDPPSAAPSG